MDETEHEGVRILGASEAAMSRPPDRSTTPPSAPSRSAPTPSWDDEDEEGWDSEWLAADGDLDLDGDQYAANDSFGDNGDSGEAADGEAWLEQADGEHEDDGLTQSRLIDNEGYAPPSAAPPVLRFEDDEAHDDGRDQWSTFTNKGPRWRSGGDDFDDADDEAVASLGSADTRVGTLDPDRGEESDLYAFADGEDSPSAPNVGRPKDGTRTSGRAGARRPAERSGVANPRPPLRQPSSRSASLGMRVATGALLIAVFIGVVAIFKEKGGVALVSLVAVVGVWEFFASLRQRGFQPAVLPGAIATFLLPIAAYSKGPAGIVITILLATLATLLWYLFGVVRDRPAVNMAVTVLGVLYVGFLAGTAGLFLANQDGVRILLGAVVGTVVYDMVGYFVGANIGRRPLAPEISPNKTVEGLLGGVIAAFMACVILGHFMSPWSASTSTAVVLGLAVAIMAPLGDLTESMIKRDLGIKDMGSLLPGHGGVLDRVDAMLFTVPAVYCIARWKGWA